MNKPFGKYHDFGLVFFGFILTGVISTWISFNFQEESWKRQYKLTLLQTEKKGAKELYVETSRLLDERIYKMLRLVWAYKNNKSGDEIHKRNEEYIIVLNKWNSSYNSIGALLDRYFGKNISFEYRENILSEFVNLGRKIENINRNDRHKIIKIEDALISLEKEVHTFNLMLIEMIKNEQIGVFMEDNIELQYQRFRNL